jgi:tRNA threonylcarbamoyladenosine biosynthesis protein TsaE
VPSREWTTHSSDETIQLGREIGRKLTPPTLILLSGDLGAGKTTLTKGIASGMGAAAEDEVTSPTFTLVHKYDGTSRVYHVDLYRIEGSHDLETLGLEDLFDEPAIVIVEWPEKLSIQTGWPVLRVQLEHVSDDTRHIIISEDANISFASR